MHAPRLAEWRLVTGDSTLRASKTPGARAGQQLQGAGAAKQLQQQAVRRLGGLDNAANVGHLEAGGGMTQWRRVSASPNTTARRTECLRVSRGPCLMTKVANAVTYAHLGSSSSTADSSSTRRP
jgi:hypothetical protein